MRKTHRRSFAHLAKTARNLVGPIPPADLLSPLEALDNLHSMLELFDQIEAATAAIQSKFNETPHAGIILGTGLGGLVEKIDVAATLDYETIPHFPRSTATSHRGRLVCGRLED